MIENSEEAHRRRGAPWTFDANAFVKFVKALQEIDVNDELNQEIWFPTFDHAQKDPVPNAGIVKSQYVFLSCHIHGNGTNCGMK